MSFILSDCKSSKQELLKNIHWTPAARFGFTLFNPNVEPFNQNSHRLFFAERVRKYIKLHFPEMIVTRSLFTEILPGYLSFEESESLVSTFTDGVEEAHFANKDFVMAEEISAANSILQKAILGVAKELKMNLILNQKEEFVGGKRAVEIASSGFWAQDPAGDLFMFFTKNLHRPLEYVWKDDVHYSKLQIVQNDITKNASLVNSMRDFNLHLIESSLFAPIVHFRRFYSTQDSISTFEYPKAITSPAPWQFKMQKSLFSL